MYVDVELLLHLQPPPVLVGARGREEGGEGRNPKEGNLRPFDT